MSQNIIRKYVWLIDTIHRAGMITFKEINQRWIDEEMSSNADPDKRDLELRTFHKWRDNIADIFGIIIACRHVGGYHYYIENADDLKRGNLRSWIIDTLAVSDLLVNNKMLKDRIMLEEVPEGREFLTVILAAMKENHPVNITYQGFGRPVTGPFPVQPYAVRMFKQRWYLVGYSPSIDQIRIYALDRFKSIETVADQRFELPSDFNVADYFKECYGTVRGYEEPQFVKLRVYGFQVNYIRSLRLHSSQEEVASTEDYSDFTLYLRPEYDFCQALLAMGSDVEVLAPDWLRNQLVATAQAMCERYGALSTTKPPSVPPEGEAKQGSTPCTSAPN